MQYNYKKVGSVIRRLRLKQNLSQELLSGLAGIARTHLTMIENGTKQANFETIWKLSQALNLTPSELVRQIEEECSNP